MSLLTNLRQIKISLDLFYWRLILHEKVVTKLWYGVFAYFQNFQNFLNQVFSHWRSVCVSALMMCISQNPSNIIQSSFFSYTLLTSVGISTTVLATLYSTIYYTVKEINIMRILISQDIYFDKRSIMSLELAEKSQPEEFY